MPGLISDFSKPVVCPMNPGTTATWSCTSIDGTGSCFAEKSKRVKVSLRWPRREARFVVSMLENS